MGPGGAQPGWAGLGAVRLGQAWPGMGDAAYGCASIFLSIFGVARLGEAGLGMAPLGLARLGMGEGADRCPSI